MEKLQAMPALDTNVMEYLQKLTSQQEYMLRFFTGSSHVNDTAQREDSGQCAPQQQVPTDVSQAPRTPDVKREQDRRVRTRREHPEEGESHTRANSRSPRRNNKPQQSDGEVTDGQSTIIGAGGNRSATECPGTATAPGAGVQSTVIDSSGDAEMAAPSH